MKTTLGQFTIVCRRTGEKYDRYTDAEVYNGAEELVFRNSCAVKQKKLAKMIKWAIMAGLITSTPLPGPRFKIHVSQASNLEFPNFFDRDALMKFWGELPHVTPGTL